jgi:hypothetical protein
MVVEDAALPGRDQLMVSQHLTSDRLNDHDHLLGGGDGHGVADQPAWYRSVREGGFEHRQLACRPVALRPTKEALTRDFASLGTIAISLCPTVC